MSRAIQKAQRGASWFIDVFIKKRFRELPLLCFFGRHRWMVNCRHYGNGGASWDTGAFKCAFCPAEMFERPHDRAHEARKERVYVTGY